MRPVRKAEIKAEAPPRVGPFADVPRWIWTIFLAAWATLFGLFLLFFATTTASKFDISIVALFVMMAFGLPAALGAQATQGNRPAADIIHTRTGPLPARAAAVQIAVIPVCAVIGLIAFITLAK
jgi:hypothetical protein